MKNKIKLSYSFLAFVTAGALAGCTTPYEEYTFAEEENTEIASQSLMEDELTFEEETGFVLEDSEEMICDTVQDDCIASEDYLTTQFVQNTGDDVVALSRPAGMKAESVKDKALKQTPSSKTEEKVLYTTIAIPEAVDGEETLVSEKTKETVVTTIQKTVPAEKENAEVVEVDVLTDDEAETSVSDSAPMIPLKKVKTTITETTSKIEQEKPRTEWSKDMTLAERVAYGQVEQEWNAESGSTLRQLLMDWGNKAGWTIVWKLDRDYNLEAGVVFNGTFTEVSSALVRSFARATPAPVGTFYQGNRVLVINTQEDENER